MSEETKAGAVIVPTIHVDPGHPMAGLINDIANPPKSGDLVEGTIIELVRGRLYVDLPPFGTVIIYVRESLNPAYALRQ